MAKFQTLETKRDSLYKESNYYELFFAEASFTNG